ncbi:MAG TPA: ABC transporter ATP-binding protein [bacterium]|jgi:energy-coupling factor transport system ATP-binding protein
MSLLVENVSYTWTFRGGRKTALESIQADFAAGVPHLLCGPSGSGKSTLGYLLSGLMTADVGRILLDGEDMLHCRTRAAHVFQSAETIFFEDTLAAELEQLSNGHGALDMTWFERFGLSVEDFAPKHPFHLSAGYGRLWATAMQLARNPQVLVLDEPTIGLDWSFQRRMLDAVKSWINPERTLIVITHDLDVMRELGGHAWVLEEGRLAWNGGTTHLLADHTLLEAYALAE